MPRTVVLLLLTWFAVACGADTGAGSSTTASDGTTTDPSSTTGASSTTTPTAPTTTVTLSPSDDWVLVQDVDDRTLGRPVVTYHQVHLDGTVVELFSEIDTSASLPLDVDVDAGTFLSRRVVAAGPGFELVERPLDGAPGTVLLTEPEWFTAEYLHDGSRRILVSTTETQRDEQGASASSEGTLRIVEHDGRTVAELQRRPLDPTGEIGWLQVELAGVPAIVLAGRPMRVLRLDGTPLADLAVVGDRWCTPARLNGDDLVAACQGDTDWPTAQVWTFAGVTGPATQLTFIHTGGVADSGAWSLWTLPTGERYVQRGGDCGAAWVEQLDQDGELLLADTIGGQIIGQDRTTLFSIAGACDGSQSTIFASDPRTGPMSTLFTSRFADDPTVSGISRMGVVWVDVP